MICFTKRKLLLLLFLPFISEAQIINTIAGNGTSGDVGDSGLATAIELNKPAGVALDVMGNVYIADWGNNKIRKLDRTGIIHTIAGNGVLGYSGDGGLATAASLFAPNSICIDDAGSVYVCENNRIRKISADGNISTIIGNGIPGYNGDEIPATLASLSTPFGIACDHHQNIYIADTYNNRIRKVDSRGIITTIAGNGSIGSGGDGEPAILATIYNPTCIATDEAGNVYFSDNNYRIRKISTTGIISAVAGSGIAGYKGDGGSAISAETGRSNSIAIDRHGNLFIADIDNHVIRIVSTTGVIVTFAGNGHKGYTVNSVPATDAQLNMPSAVAVDTAGNVYLSDNQTHIIRKISVPPSPIKGTALGDLFNVSANLEKGTLTITSDTSIYKSFTITDNTEKIILRQPITSVQTVVDISLLLPGYYHVNLNRAGKENRVMFVKK